MTINVGKCASIIFTFNDNIFNDVFIYKSKVSEVDKLKLLGAIISKSLNSKSHGTHVLTKAAVAMAMIRKLKGAGMSEKYWWSAYILYCWPAVCDMPQSILGKYIQIEKQACKLSGRAFSQSEMFDHLNNTCIKLIKSIVSHENHPLRQLFLTRNSSNYSLPSLFSLLPLNR